LETVKWLLEEGGATKGIQLVCGELATVQYLLEHGGADIGDTLSDGDTLWDLLDEYLIESGIVPDVTGVKPYVYDATAVTSLLRVMVLRGAPPAD
jgi:hypothetical protein